MIATVGIRSDYLHTMLDPVTAMPVFSRMLEDIDRSKVEYDAIAFTGVSGALIAPVLSMLSGKPLIVVRKSAHESSHSLLKVEGCFNAATYIIADDFVATGQTLHNIVSSITAWSKAKCVGCIGMRPDSFDRSFNAEDKDGKCVEIPNLSYVEMETRPLWHD